MLTICRWLWLAALSFAVSGCAWFGERDAGLLSAVQDAGGITYEASITGTEDEPLLELLRQNLRLFAQAERKPASVARLRRRAEADVDTAKRVLRSEGFYAGKASLGVQPGTDATPAQVAVRVEPGVRFEIERFDIETAAPVAKPEASELRLPVGAPARAEDIMAAEQRALRWFFEHGHPHAKFTGRRAVASPERSALTVTSTFDPGPAATLGNLQVEGLSSVNEAYVRTYKPWGDGQTYQRSRLDGLQQELAATGLFETVKVEPGDVVAAPGASPQPQPAPIKVTVTEGLHRSVGGGLRYSTGEGPAAKAFLEHRNVAGANETVRLSTTLGLDLQELSLRGRKPQFLVDGQSLLAGVVIRNEQDEAFDEQSLTLDLGLERKLSKRLVVTGGISVELADFEGTSGSGKSVLFGLPLSARYDASNSLLDPTSGYRLRAELTPYAGTFDANDVQFLVTDVSGSAYWSLDGAGRYVLAGRTRLASAVGADRDRIPPAQRLYAGGGGSVRGYEARFVGPLDGQGEPVGGRSAVELGLELRARITENVGIVPFFEAGAVSDAVVPDLDASVQFAAGLGVRYYTVVGPVRADIAVPLNPRDSDDAFQFYISIGQAF